MHKLARFLKRYRVQVILGPVFKLTEAVLELIVPIITAMIIDNGVKKGDAAYVWRMGGVLLLLGAVGLCCALVCQKMASIASQGFGTVLRNEVYRHINSLSHAEIDQLGTPSLITRITNDVNQLQYAVAMLIRLVIRAPFLAIGAIVMAMILDFQMGLIFLLATPLIALVLYLVMSRSVPFFKVMQKKLDKISLISREGLSGVRVIRAFSKQQNEEKRFNEAADDQARTAVQVGKLSALLNPLTYTIMNFAIIAIIWFGGMRVDGGSLEQGEIIALVNYMTQTLLALIVVANLVVTFTKASASAARVNEVLALQPSVSDAGNQPVQPDLTAPKIRFRQVSFSYDGSDKYALKNLSVDIQKGETVGIIGGTGSGKSTLVQLIPRFYDATKGEVLVDGIDVRAYPFQQLRKEIGMVPQEAVLFSGTIESNLRWAKQEASGEELRKALRVAQALDFVEKLPDGLRSPVNQGGKNFSGGQKQRLTIARALVGDPQILILDDSSSALDFATDAALRRAIRQETQNMTVLIVTQRASAIKQADKIIVLDDGAVVGIGNHRDLLESCEVYREICLSQLNKEEVESA
ncbi:ABC transporter ATP-binding protein [Hydrogeniiclostridium mannosilyticum]|uniref:ABC transporter ATP-binding protein n=1 Tax=Hydrogeniiclostridium mannosilyticum TaxID=2764322 RepID=UPI0018AAE6D7|nr:ABC transporter ATP-binding protein [Hydrogeniiclostridium mannosilyticum]